MARYGLCVDLRRCIGCYGCVVACKNWHDIPFLEGGRIRLEDITTGAYPDASRWMFPVMCMHCSYPPCVSVCRFKACKKREDGIVFVDPKKCVGCELCVLVCPYNARHIINERHIADSCDLCAERIDSGMKPYCVETCPLDAIIFGDLDDPESKIVTFIKVEGAQRLGKKYGTKPEVFYAGIDVLQKIKDGILFNSK